MEGLFNQLTHVWPGTVKAGQTWGESTAKIVPKKRTGIVCGKFIMSQGYNLQKQ